jgi:hypothetical protein
VAQAPPTLQGALFAAAMAEIGRQDDLVNEVIEVLLEGAEVVFKRYAWPL